MKPFELGCTNALAPVKPSRRRRHWCSRAPAGSARWHGRRTASLKPPSLYLEHCSHSSRRLRGGRRRDRIVVAGAPRCSCWLERSATRNLTHRATEKGFKHPPASNNTWGPFESTTATFHVLAEHTQYCPQGHSLAFSIVLTAVSMQCVMAS